MRQNKLAEAETAYRAAIQADPQMSTAHANLGVVYYQRGNLAKAADAFEAALRLKADDAQTVYLLGVVRIQEDNLTEAEKLLIRARDLDPNLPEVYYGLGVLYKLRGEKDAAIAAFEKFLEIGPGQDKSAADYAKDELAKLKGQ
ncbi:MAG: TPR repeat-containing protein YrrB [Chloroflexi bacterium ADurb.Bin325]|nr:MAG: TPR repeat-containing protein YrrB [Chloroflexi bacterium ADurb.Bin325]